MSQVVRVHVVAFVFLVTACGGSSPTEPAPPEAGEDGFRTEEPALARGLDGASVSPLVSVGDMIPGSSEPVAPAPDGIGTRPYGGQLVLHVSHELSGIPRVSGGEAYAAGRVSRFALDTETLDILEHEYIVDGSEGYRPFGSGTWVDSDDGFPGGYYFTGEKSANGVQLAIDADGGVLEMPWVGRFNHDNQIPIRGLPNHVAVLNFDDAGGQDVAESELYMYVAASGEEMLAGEGQLYVLESAEADDVGELAVGGSITGRWIAVPDEIARDFEALQEFAHDEGTLSFVRLEDGFHDRRPGASPAAYFYDTGRNSITNGGAEPLDKWGSIYRIAFDDPADPAGGTATLSLLARSDGPQSGWASPNHGAMRPDGVFMLQEDPAAGVWGRPPAVFRLEFTADGSLADPVGTKVVEVVDPDCDEEEPCNLEEWETTGITDASEWLGPGTWLFTVMAHDKPVPSLDLAAEHGQILLLEDRF